MLPAINKSLSASMFGNSGCKDSAAADIKALLNTLFTGFARVVTKYDEETLKKAATAFTEADVAEILKNNSDMMSAIVKISGGKIDNPTQALQEAMKMFTSTTQPQQATQAVAAPQQ